MEYKRNQDVTKVFDARWNANHNDDVQRMRERDRIRSEKILSANDRDYLNEKDFEQVDNMPKVQSSMEIQLERLNKNMEALRQNRGNFND